MRSTGGSGAASPVFIFDFGGVVIKWKNNNPIFDSIAERYFIPRDEMRRVFEASLLRLESGELSMKDYLEESLAVFGKKPRKGDSPDDLWTRPFEKLVAFRQGTLKIVEALRKKGFRVYLFSNTSPPHAKLLRQKKWDKLFDGFLSSCELGEVKPEAEAFRRVVASIGSPPSEVVFIDDKEENVKGALSFGIRWAFKFTTLQQLRRDLEPWLRDARAS